ncbi:hypothetical protein Afil01_49930 [Actinorhabdospora filicis]|uniref:Low temperature requirement protein LtrA n=1 Tax=Actinorhabdospora filicis TaxID=1785913 RepID=A0A9W6SSZ4_9ACTN|nr:low temperature requirement protein A [Actinorhabdospora filicis]GLZ80186.1 hypothetical protein Afil01_49930 [Actinorhabdospora filicis]
MTATVDHSERHASWLELFFDLVVVAAVAQLAHRVHDEPTALGIAAFALLYYAVWAVWTNFSVYANVAGDRTRLRSMLQAMFGIAVMAAAIPATIPQVLHHEGDVDRSTVFAIAYVCCRIAASGVWRKSNMIVTAWPAAQVGAGIAPWFASFWVDDPKWKYGLWALGCFLDVLFTFLQSLSPNRVMEEAKRRTGKLQQRAAAALERGATPRTIPDAAEGRLDLTHLGERLGLFVIIVLGEGVIQVVTAAGDPLSHWDQSLAFAALAGFALLVGLWWLTLRYGVLGVPQFEAETPVRVTLPGHFVATASITAVAAGLGAVAGHADKALPTGTLWLMCGGLALHFAATGLLALLSRAPAHWLLLWGLPCVLAPVAIALLGRVAPGWLVAALLACVVGWQCSYGMVRKRRFAAA